MPPSLRKVRESLTATELAVLEKVGRFALDNDEVAERLGITRRATKFHVSNLLRKLGVTSREKLIVLYWQDRYRELEKQQKSKPKGERIS